MGLTTESQDSMLQGVGDLSKGNIVSGFGTAEVSGLTSRGASNLYEIMKHQRDCSRTQWKCL